MKDSLGNRLREALRSLADLRLSRHDLYRLWRIAVGFKTEVRTRGRSNQPSPESARVHAAFVAAGVPPDAPDLRTWLEGTSEE